MKVLVLNGSPRENGRTGELKNYFLSFLKGAQIKEVCAFDFPVIFCDDCRKCAQQPMLCVKKDRMYEIYDALTWADVIVIATPIYFNSVPAPLKAIFDRMNCLFNKKFIHKEPRLFRRKRGITLVTSGDARNESVFSVKSQLKMIFDCADAVVFGAVFAMNTDRTPELSMSYAKERAKEIALALIEEFEENEKNIG